MGKAAEARDAWIRSGELLSECMATFIILGLGDSAAGGGLYQSVILPFLPARKTARAGNKGVNP
jgi:hypothetical protein